MAKRKYTVHQRIMRAHRAGRGVSLNAQDVDLLAQDHAIVEAARNDDAADAVAIGVRRHRRHTGHKVARGTKGSTYAACLECAWSSDDG